MLVNIKIIEINKKNRLIKKFPKMNVIGNKDNSMNNIFSIKLRLR